MPSLLASQIASQIAQGKATLDAVPNGMKKEVAYAMAIMGLGPNVKNTDLDKN